jgi:hypothetical protein
VWLSYHTQQLAERRIILLRRSQRRPKRPLGRTAPQQSSVT